MTLTFPIQGSSVLLGLKQVRFGKGNWNGFGGKVEPGETCVQAAVRELYEEACLAAHEEHLRHRADISFVYPNGTHEVAVFTLDAWSGEPGNTKEMHPQWFPVTQLPFHQMWADDPHWLPQVLAGEELAAIFYFNEDGKTIKDFSITRGL